MTTEFDRALDAIEAAITKAETHLKLDSEKRALNELRQQAGSWRAIQDNIGAIRSEIIEPVNNQLATGNRLSTRGFWVGLCFGVGGGVLSLILFALSHPIQTAADLESIALKLQNLDSIDTRLQNLERITTTQTGASTPPAPVEGEIKVELYRYGVLLEDKDESQLVAMRLISIFATEEAGETVFTGWLELYENGRQVGGARLAQIIGRTTSDLDEQGSRFSLKTGDKITLYGAYQFNVTRILSDQLFARPYADDISAVFLLKAE